MYLIFDTETTGLPKNWKAPMSEVDNWPRVIQLAWECYDSNRKLLMSRSDLIRPDGWEMPTGDFWVKNGFTNAINMERGIPIRSALDFFLEAIDASKYIIAHNMSFDHNILGAEMIRAQVSVGYRLEKICTKDQSTNYCRLPGPRGYKWPKLEELHRHLFGKDFDGAHDAGSDVAATAKCFFELLDRQVINLTPQRV